jgi:hypothetical protein
MIVESESAADDSVRPGRVMMMTMIMVVTNDHDSDSDTSLTRTVSLRLLLVTSIMMIVRLGVIMNGRMMAYWPVASDSLNLNAALRLAGGRASRSP